MSKATIRDYGTVDFDPMVYDSNVYDLWCVAICEGEQVVSEEHYTDEDGYRSALRDTYGREFMDEQQEPGLCDVWYNGEQYECECVYHIAYIIDHDED